MSFPSISHLSSDALESDSPPWQASSQDRKGRRQRTRIAELIIDAEFVALVAEVDPGLHRRGHIGGGERAGKREDVKKNTKRRPGLRHQRKVTGAVMHALVEKRTQRVRHRFRDRRPARRGSSPR